MDWPQSNGNRVRIARYDRNDTLLNETLFEYDGRNLLTKKADAEGNEHTYEYDEIGRKIAEIDPRGNRTEFFYDTMGNLVSVTDDLGNATWHTYDLNNRRVKTENALGHVTGYRYDNVGNPVAVIDAMGQRTNFWYDAVNRKIGRQDPAGGTTVFDYDENGNLTGTTDPAGSTTLYAYDADNRRTSEIRVLADATEAATVTQYDELGRVETVTDRTGTETEFGYDDVLNLKNSVTRAYGTADEVVTIFHYDSNGRLDEKIEAYGTSDEATTEYKYDDTDNLTDIINANGETVTYTYDLLGRRLREYDADGSYLRAEYDGAGNMTRVVKRDGTEIDATFDDLNRKTAVTVNGTLAQTFAFDALSRMVEAVDRNQGRAVNTASWEYDALNRVTAEVQNGLRVEKGYDANSNLEVLAYPSFKVVERTFNADNTLSQVWDGTGTIAINQYYAHGVPSQVNLGNGILLSLTQDDEDKETGRDYTLSGTAVYSMATVWDFRDNVAQETENRGGSDIVKDFGYDNLDRITSQTVDTEQSVWQYDDVGNWTSTNQNGVSETRSVNADNEYTFITGMNPAHDANGNLVSDGTRNYVYDWANRLSEVWSGGQKLAEYTYDATNRRVSKYLPPSSESFTFVYNDGQVIEEYLNSSLARTYTYGAYIDDPLMVEYGGQRYFYLKDRRYSVTGLTDTAGSIVETYEYSAYGRMTIYDASGQDITATGSTIGNPYGFTGRRFDAETGLWYYRNRMYSPALGRFLQRDPAGYVDGINLYSYTMNNPLSYLDPEGLAVRWASDKIETRITEASSYLETGLNIFSDYMTEHSAEIEQDVQGVVEKSGVENLQSTLNTMAVIGGAGELLPFGGAVLSSIGGEAFLIGAKAGGTAGLVVGTVDFITELGRGKSTIKSLQRAMISGSTAFATIGSASTGAPYAVAGLIGTTTNMTLEKAVHNEVNLLSSLYSGFSTTLGGFGVDTAKKSFKISLPWLSEGIFHGQIQATTNELGKIFLEADHEK